MKFKTLEHTADIKFQVEANNLEELFDGVAQVFSHQITRGVKISGNLKKKIKLEGKDNEEILYKFLDELIFFLDANGFLVSSAKVKITKINSARKKLEGVLLGTDASKYNGLDHIKAATYAEMFVKKKKTGWTAQFVLDV